MNASEVMTDVTSKLVEMIEAGATDWRMPWRKLGATGLPVNALTGKNYRGGNVLALSISGIQQGFTSNTWATFKQWQEVGPWHWGTDKAGVQVKVYEASVRKGEHGTRGLIYKPLVREVENVKTGELELKSSAFASVFVVFCRDQVDGLPELPPTVPVEPLELLQHVEAWFDSIPAQITYGGDRACYSPSLDVVRMPGRDQFSDVFGLYGTLAHELAHWTGNSLRLNRTYGKRFGDDAYAAEELVAELSSAFTCATLGIDTVARTDHAPYLASWCKALKADPGILWSVGGKAQAATDYLQSFTTADIGTVSDMVLVNS